MADFLQTPFSDRVATVQSLLDSGSIDPTILPMHKNTIDPTGALVLKRLKRYETAGGGQTTDEIYDLLGRLQSDKGETIFDFVSAEVGIEDDDGEEPLSGLLPFKRVYFATNPAPSSWEVHVAAGKKRLIRLVKGGQGTA
jgi:hypothetical protein